MWCGWMRATAAKVDVVCIRRWIEFTAGGQTYSFESDNASDPPVYSVGEELPVLYDPAGPETAQINSFFERWVFPMIILPAMILAALIVNFFMIRSLRRGETNEV